MGPGIFIQGLCLHMFICSTFIVFTFQRLLPGINITHSTSILTFYIKYQAIKFFFLKFLCLSPGFHKKKQL